jgi:hypothetical protein
VTLGGRAYERMRPIEWDESPGQIDTSASGFGFAPGSWFRGLSNAERDADLDDMAAIGATWVRVEADQWLIQPTDAVTFDWPLLDPIVLDILARGMRPLLVLCVTPPWARGAGPGWYPPDSLATFANWCTAVVNRYKPGGTLGLTTGVTAYEVWNEPNLISFWLSGPSPSQYAAMLQAAYPAIKAADPSATVISGGMSPAATDGTNFLPTDFLSAVYAAGGGDSFDALGHHPYCSPALPGEAQSWSAWYQMFGTPTSLRSIMEAQGDGGKRIWATEWGTFTNGPIGDAVSVQTEQGQADHLATAMAVWRTYSWAGPLMVYEYRDLDTSDGGPDGLDATTRENHYGIVWTDRTAKPAHATFEAGAAEALAAAAVTMLRAVSDALLSPLDPLDEIVHGDEGGDHPPFALAVHAEHAPLWVLPWLANLVGVVWHGAPTEDLRALILDRPAFRRGTTAAIVEAARATLTGSQYVFVVERDTSPWRLTVVTLASETPDAAETYRQMLRQKPFGLVLTHTVAAGKTWAESVGTWAAATPTWDAALTVAT